jgi:D-psicose/D-tagatose/L-ribulose 3-epimerase
MNKIGIHFGYFSDNWDPDFFALMDRASKIGFDILEVPAVALMSKTEAQRAEIVIAAKDKGLELTFSVGLSADQDFSSEDGAVRKNGIDFTMKALKIMDEMGAKIYAGVINGGWNTTYTYGVTDKTKEIKRSVASVKEIMKAAEAYGVTYAIEVVNRYEQPMLNTAEEAMEYIKMVNSPNCKILLDTYHMNIEEDSFSDAIRLVGKEKLGHFHVGEPNRKPPKPDGRMPWNEITAALKEIDYTGAIVMEPFIKMGGDVARDIKVWRDISKKATPVEMDQLAKTALNMLREKMK